MDTLPIVYELSSYRGGLFIYVAKWQCNPVLIHCKTHCFSQHRTMQTTCCHLIVIFKRPTLKYIPLLTWHDHKHIQLTYYQNSRVRNKRSAHWNSHCIKDFTLQPSSPSIKWTVPSSSRDRALKAPPIGSGRRGFSRRTAAVRTLSNRTDLYATGRAGDGDVQLGSPFVQ